MPFRSISRRHFIERSIKGGLAVGLEAKFAALRGSASEIPGDNDALPGPGLTLEIEGDPKRGYSVSLLFNGEHITENNRCGEFSARFQNEERSLEDHVSDWRAKSWSGDSRHFVLLGECQLKDLNTTVFVRVDYEVITPHTLRKNVRFLQNDMFMMFYQMSNRLQAVERPLKFWSFDQLNWSGGSLREYFPAAGFRTKRGLCVGLLTDSGYRNQWTRMIRRDGKPVKPAPGRIPDANLYSGASLQEQGEGNFFIQQTFGEILVEDTQMKGQMVAVPGIAAWRKHGDVRLEEHQGAVAVSTRNSDDGALIPLPVPFAAQEPGMFSVRLEYRSDSPVAIGIWDVDDSWLKLNDITLYNDGLPASPDVWSEFKTTVFVPSLEGAGCAVFVSVAPSEQATKVGVSGNFARVEIRGLQIQKVVTHSEPYHRLEMDEAAEKTVFVFANESVPDTVRGHRLASEIYLADGLGFKGGETEKVVYSDLMMLCWIAGPETFRPICAPSIWYSAAGEMYLRDSFFALNGIHNRALNEQVFNLWGDNQGEDGAINTLVEPNLANVERKSNDSTPLWLMWAFLNRRRFGTVLPMEKVGKAAEYCLRTYDPEHKGLCWAKFVMGQLDVIRYPEGTSVICENQGMLAVMARVIKELQILGVSDTISEKYLEQAEELYRSYYDPVRKFMRPARDIADAIGFAEIFPEFLSLWLFNRKILSDEMVVNHLNRIPAIMPRKDCPHPDAGGTVRPILIGLPEQGEPWSYFNDRWHPMISDSFAASYANHGMDGIYYNGGSWMRIEICGYVTGKLHRWSDATKAIENRLWAELNLAADFPTSQEYIATDPAHPFFGYHRVFAWNSFVLQALEVGGLRDSKMDPDARK